MPLKLRIESELDERSASAAATRAEKIYTESAQKMSRELSEGLTKGAREGGRAIDQMADQARASYKRVGDATDDLREHERLLKEMREEGARGVEVQAERVRAARKRERLAIKEAAAAYDEYETAAKRAGEAGEQAISGGMQGAAGGAASFGQDAADNFMGGFAGSSALMSLGARGGPIGIALASAAALGYMTGKVLVDNISAGMATMQTRDLFQARLGVDEATMSRYGNAAANAFTSAWGESIPDNLRAVQFAIQGGVIDRDASDAEIEQTIGQMQALAGIMEVDVSEAARASGQLIRGGFAQSGTEAADIIASGFQRGLDISGDWLDTITEYTTQFRKLGLEGNDALGLIQQGLEAGARDSDKVADSLKEFSIRAVDGSKLTAEGFASLGFDADDMAARFLAGGESARQAFGVTLTAIKSLDDPVQQALTWQALFGTQWEDMGDAINSMDLSTARTQFADTEGAIDSATATLSAHVDQWDVLGRKIDTTFAKLKEWLADSAVGEFLGGDLPNFLGNIILPDPAGDAQAQLDAAVAERRAQERNFANGTMGRQAGVANPLGLGGPTPGERTPMLTDTQQAALDEASGGSKSLPAAPSLPLQYTSTAGMPAAIANAQTRLDEVRHQVAEKQARVNQLEQSNLATEEDIQKARNDLTKAERDQQQAEQALHESRMSAYEKQASDIGQMSSQMGEIGAALDSDLGISKGLPGIAENLVRFAATLAAAPLVGPLSAISNARGDEGSGLVGMLASSGALGPQFMPGAASSSIGPASGAALLPGGGSNVDAMMALAQRSSGGRYVFGGSDLANGLSDCSGAVSDLVEILTTGQTTPGRLFSTGDAAQVLAGLGFQQGFMPGALNIGFKNGGPGGGHMAATLPNGVAFESGGGTGQGATYGGAAVGANDPQFTDRWFLPVGGGGGGFGGGGSVSSPISSAGGGTVPVFVVNMPGGGGFPAALAPGAPTSPGSAPAAPGADPGGYLNSNIAPGIADAPGLNSPENTNPALNNPPAPGAPLPPLGSLPGSGGPLGLPGVGMPGSAGMGGLGGQSYPGQGGGEGGIGLGGMALDGIMAATSGLDMMAPGAGAAAKVGIQVANRAAKYAGQVGGIVTGGILDTLTPAGDKPQASIGNSWFGKIAGGIASAAPALPNMAGGKKPPGPMDGPGGQQGGQGQGGNTIHQNLTLHNNHATEDIMGNQSARELGAAYMP